MGNTQTLQGEPIETDGEKKKKNIGKDIEKKVSIQPNPTLEQNARNKPEDLPLRDYAKKVTQKPELLLAVRKTLEKVRLEPLERNLKGTMFPAFFLIKNKAYYEGEWKEGLPHGYGCLQLNTGTYYEGNFEEGQAGEGEGFYIYPDGSYKRGYFSENLKLNGHGKFERPNGFRYVGRWVHDQPHGKGTEYYPNGCVYQGDFKNGVKESQYAVFRWPSGKIYKGGFKGGFMEGEGTLKMDFGKGKGQFKGKFLRNEKQGTHAVMKTELGDYVGGFKNGVMEGQGRFLWNDGKYYQGEFKEGKMWGKGFLIFPEGLVIEGQWNNGENIRIFSAKDDPQTSVKDTMKKEDNGKQLSPEEIVRTMFTIGISPSWVKKYAHEKKKKKKKKTDQNT